MLRLLLAALLAVFTLPAQAATFIKYTATGDGAEWVNDPNPKPETGTPFNPIWVTATAFIPMDGSCWDRFECAITETSMTFTVMNDQFGPPSMTLNFSDGVAAPRMSAASFTGGTANWMGGLATLTKLTVETVEVGDPYLSTGWLEITTRPQAVPEPSTWAMMIAGFGLLGGALRQRSTRLATSLR